MGFPYLQPIKSWMVDELEAREQAPELQSMKKPFAILTSAATVSKANTYEAALSGSNNTNPSYFGCIIANNAGERNYDTNATAIGYDFAGKKIVVEGETNYRRPMPIINSIMIDTDGDNNALKTAQISVTLFSLKQFEMFELFFCRPGYNVMVEYGNNAQLNSERIDIYKKKFDIKNSSQNDNKVNNTQLNTTSNKTGNNIALNIDNLIIAKDDYSTFKKTTFKKYYAVSDDDLSLYYNKILESRGNYDVFAGKVTEFTMEIGEGGIYNVNLTLSAGNTVTLAIPSTVVSDTSKIAVKDETGRKLTQEEIILRAMQIDLNMGSYLQADPKDIKIHTFNFIRAKEKQKDSYSDKRYLTLYFILKYLVNYTVNKTSLSDKIYLVQPQTIQQGDKTIEAIPCNSDPYLISSSEDIIFPGKLPTISIGDDKEKRDELKLQVKKPRDCKINDLDFDIQGDVIKLGLQNYNQSTKKHELIYKQIKIENSTVGNALNIFVNYEQVVEMWAKSTTRAEFVNGVLDVINKNSYGLYQLTICPLHGDSGPVTIIDRKFKHITNDYLQLLKEDKVYRFKPNSINSIVKSFSMELDMGNLVAGQTVFQTTMAIENALREDSDVPKDEHSAQQYFVQKDHLSAKYKNGDGFYSVDGVEVELIMEGIKKGRLRKKATEAFDTVAKANEDKKKKVTEKPPDAAEIIDSKVTRFKLPNGKMEILILNDKDNVLKYLTASNLPTNSPIQTLSSLKVTISLGGISGFSSGEYFRLGGIPEIYNINGVFQITNVKHSIDVNEWNTEVEAMWLILDKK